MLKVCKFGGTSLASAAGFRRVKNIILSDPARKIIVASAPGKTSLTQKKVTDLLIDYYFLKNSAAENILRIIISRFSDIVNDLSLDIKLDGFFDFQGKSYDYVLSRGEYINSYILAKFLGFNFLDPFLFLTVNRFGKLSVKRSQHFLKDYDLSRGVVVPGFYCRTPKGRLKIFDRGGSDLTGAYLSRIVHADIYENFSDVSGIMMADPNIVPSPRYIDFLTFKEFSSLDFLAPTVLHKSAYKPVIGTKTRIVIKNTFNPVQKGTVISARIKDKTPRIISVAASGCRIKITGRRLKKIKNLKKSVRRALKGVNQNLKAEVFTNTRFVFSISGNPQTAVKAIYKTICP